jgi:hypothetical protein
MAMSLYRKTFLDSTQITGSLVSNDGVALDTNSAVSGTLEDNLNAIRSAIKLVLGSTTSDTWWDVVAQANGLNLVQLNSSLSGTLNATDVNLVGHVGLTSTFVTGTHGLFGNSTQLDPMLGSIAGAGGFVNVGGFFVSGANVPDSGPLSSVTLLGNINIGGYSPVASPDPNVRVALLDNDNNESIAVAGSYDATVLGSWVHSGSLILGSVGESGGFQRVLLVSGTQTTNQWTTFATNFGAGDLTQTGIIDAINATWAAASAAGVSLTGKQTFSDATIAANTDFEVSASIGGTAYTYKSIAGGGSPTDEIEVFFNGILLSGSNYQGANTNGADWARGNDSTKPYKIKLAFDVASVDVVNVIFRNPISVA